jgi:hypothetical protein
MNLGGATVHHLSLACCPLSVVCCTDTAVTYIGCVGCTMMFLLHIYRAAH